LPVNEWLSDLLTNPDLTITQKIHAVLLDAELPGYTTAYIKLICRNHGASDAEKWNIPAFLKPAQEDGRVKKIDASWSLTAKGRIWLAEGGVMGDSVVIRKRDEIRKCLVNITNPQTRQFVAEAILCVEAGALRASVMMAWIGAVSILYDHVFNGHLAAFNTDAPSVVKCQPIVNVDDFSKMREADFLKVLEHIHVIGQNEKSQLETCLDWRNSSGHPNEAVIGEHMVAAHIEILINTVYSKFS